MFADLLIEPAPSKYSLTCSNNLLFSGFTSAHIEYTMLILNPNFLEGFDLKRIEKLDSPSL
jgi:hypothetical protein